MRGLRKREESKFEKFFEIVQNTAKEKGCVFFADCGEGRDIETDEISGEDLTGWLVPAEFADEFEAFFGSGKCYADAPAKFDDCFMWAEWEETPEGIKINFVEH